MASVIINESTRASAKKKKLRKVKASKSPTDTASPRKMIDVEAMDVRTSQRKKKARKETIPDPNAVENFTKEVKLHMSQASSPRPDDAPKTRPKTRTDGNEVEGKRALFFRVLDGSMIRGVADLPDDPQYYVRLSNVYQAIIMGMILLSIVTFLIDTVPSEWDVQSPTSLTLEIIIVVVFTVDYVLRVVLTREARFWLPMALRCMCLASGPKWLRSCFGTPCANGMEASMTPVQRRTGFVWQPLNQVDFWSVFPFYLEHIIIAASSDDIDVGAFTVLRVLRLFRIFRVFKTAKYSQLLRVVGKTLKKSTSGFLLLLMSTSMAALLFGAVEFYAENLTYCEFVHDREDSEFGRWVYKCSVSPPGCDPMDPESRNESPYQSVLDGVWWAFVTLTTVGYGDKFPLSPLGQVFAVLTVLSGLVVLAFPITIIGNNFADVTSSFETQDVERYVVDLEDEKTRDLSTAKMLNIIGHTLRQQAVAINELQTSLDNVGIRWRVIETAYAIVDGRHKGVKRDRQQSNVLDIGFDVNRAAHRVKQLSEESVQMKEEV